LEKDHKNKKSTGSLKKDLKLDLEELEKFETYLAEDMLCVDYYAMPDKGGKPWIVRKDRRALQRVIDDGYGLFFTVNDFMEHPRIKENLRTVNFLHVDLDTGTKEEQLKVINKLPI